MITILVAIGIATIVVYLTGVIVLSVYMIRDLRHTRLSWRALPVRNKVRALLPLAWPLIAVLLIRDDL